MTMPAMPTADANLETILQQALSQQNGASQANAEMEPNPPLPDGTEDGETASSTQGLNPEQIANLQKAMYGDLFPLAQVDYAAMDEQSKMSAWAAWARAQWDVRSQSVTMHLHLIARNRLFRAGYQWLQSRNNGTTVGPWASPPRPKESVRCVCNMVDKALDQRLQILTDQRPGFSITPMTSAPEDKRKAQARQAACEYQYEQQSMDIKAREAAYWAQTDGASFWHTTWDPDRGPWDDRMGPNGSKAPLGDLNTTILRVEQVRVSPEATTSVPPSWVVVRDVIAEQEAVFRYGLIGLQASEAKSMGTGHSQMTGGTVDSVASWVVNQTTVGEGQRLKDTATVERFTVYLAPHADVLPKGLQVVIVGDTVVFGPSDLLFGVIPVVRVTDGSSDPSFYPRPTVEQWLDYQTRYNTILSKWHENIRINAGGRFFGRPNMTVTETFIGGVSSFVEVPGGGPLSDNVMPVQGFSVGEDVKEALAMEKQAFEDASGWSAVSRGQVTGDSGRAIIASREQLERVFAPAVQSMATAYTEWCKVQLAGMSWGYDVPRALGAVGKNRPDLAREITGADLDGAVDVKVEKTTMMPMPFSYRMYMLDNWLQVGVIDMKEYRRRQMFAVARDISTPDEDQEARGKRIADAIIMGQPVPAMRWTDDESIHQDVLQREILTQDDLPEPVIQLAMQRWTELANQAQMKMAPAPMPEQGQKGSAPASLPALPPTATPLASSNSPFGVAPALQAQMQGTTDDEQRAQAADRLMPQ